MKIKAIFFSFFCYFCLANNVYSGIEKYFKPALNKESNHSIRNIDFIYMINLDQRPEKFNDCFSALAFYGITPYRFSAVNGWELPLETINELGVVYDSYMNCKGLWGTSYLPENNFKETHEIINTVGRNYFCHCMSRGAIGIVLSHLSVLQDAYDSGYQVIWVMEDDIKIDRNPQLISSCVDMLNLIIGKDKWDILFTDRDTKNQKGEYVPCLGYAKRPNFSPLNPNIFSKKTYINSDFHRIGARYGAYSMVISRSGMKKILDFFKKYKIFLPYDMDYFLVPNIRLYSVFNDIVSTKIQALSDNGAPNYLNR